MNEPLLWNTLSEAVEFLNHSSNEDWSERKILNTVLISSKGEETCLQWVLPPGTKFGLYGLSEADHIENLFDDGDGPGPVVPHCIEGSGCEELEIGALPLNKKQVQEIFMRGETAVEVIKRLPDEVISDDLGFLYRDCDRHVVVEPYGTPFFVTRSMVVITFDALKSLVSTLKTSDKKSTIAAPADAASNGSGRLFSESPRKIKKAALIKKYRYQWRTAEMDINAGSNNDLGLARLEHGYYDEQKALQWASERGKLTETGPSGSPILSMADISSRIVKGPK